jgi:GNAT superfamily N-acetyltransferase
LPNLDWVTAVDNAPRASIEIRPIAAPARFLALQPPFYRNDRHYVPPLPASEAWQLDPRKNPFFQHAEVGFFGAFTGDRCVGRVSACRDRLHDEFHGDRIGFFGHFEANDAATTATLVAHAAAWCKQRGADALRGPVDLSTNNRCGLLVEGDAGPPVMMMPHNPPHYAPWLEATGLTKVKDLVALYGDKHGLDRGRMDKLFMHLQKRTQATFRRVELKRFNSECGILWRLYEQIWERNWGFVPMPEAEFLVTAKDLKRIAHPALMHIAEVDGKPAGFIIALPDVNQATKACGGRLLPFGWWKFLRTLKATTHIRVLTMGVVPELRRAGIDVMLMHRVMQQGIDAGFGSCEASWILEDNRDMLGPLATMGMRVYRRYRVYEKALRP